MTPNDTPPILDRKLKILFACTQNAVRSVIAEGLLCNAQHPAIEMVRSCGVIAGVADGFTIAVMADIGIDVSDHEPISFDHFQPDDFDVIISFSKDAEYYVRDWAEDTEKSQFWDVKPPIHSEHSRDETLMHYQHLRDEIAGRIEHFLQELPS